jgi:hypothetical protein
MTCAPCPCWSHYNRYHILTFECHEASSTLLFWWLIILTSKGNCVILKWVSLRFTTFKKLPWLYNWKSCLFVLHYVTRLLHICERWRCELEHTYNYFYKNNFVWSTNDNKVLFCYLLWACNDQMLSIWY